MPGMALQCAMCTGDMRRCGESEASGHWADATSLEPEKMAPLFRCFFFLGEKGVRRTERGGPPSWKKAIRERRRARFIFSQWEHEALVSSASAWEASRQVTYSSWPSAELQSRSNIWNNSLWNCSENLLFSSSTGWPQRNSFHCRWLGSTAGESSVELQIVFKCLT